MSYGDQIVPGASGYFAWHDETADRVLAIETSVAAVQSAATAEAAARQSGDSAAMAAASAALTSALASRDAAITALQTGKADASALTAGLAAKLDASTAAATYGATRTSVKTAAYTAAPGDLVPVDTTAGPVTITLPTAPAAGSRVTVKHVLMGTGNTVTIACGGSDVINRTGGATSASLSLLAQSAVLVYSSGIWTIVSADTPLAQLDARYPRTVNGTAPDGTGNIAVGGTDPTVNALVAKPAGSYKGAWASTTAYVVGDLVLDALVLWEALTAHTSNAAGRVIDREKWRAVTGPLAPDVLVPVKGVVFTDAGSGEAAAPTAGLFQVLAPRQSYRKAKRVWAITDTTKIATTYGTAQAAVNATSAPGGAVTIGCPSGSGGGYRPAAFTATNFTGGHFRIPIKLRTRSAIQTFSLRLYSGATYGANYVTAPIANSATAWPRTDGWCTVSIGLSDFTTVGTGADLTAITMVEIFCDNGTGAFDCDVQYVDWHPNLADKAKLVIWLDDGFASHTTTTIPKMIAKGFPGVLAYIADRFGGSSTILSPDFARYLQDQLGWQIATHAFGVNDHNRVQDGELLSRQLLEYKHFGRALGLHGVDDGATWNTGYPAVDTPLQHQPARKHMRSLRGGTTLQGETLPVGDPTNTRARMTTVSDTFTGTWQPLINKAVADKGLVQLVFHDMTNTALITEFDSLLTYLDANRATVDTCTIAEALDPIARGTLQVS